MSAADGPLVATRQIPRPTITASTAMIATRGMTHLRRRPGAGAGSPWPAAGPPSGLIAGDSCGSVPPRPPSEICDDQPLPSQLRKSCLPLGSGYQPAGVIVGVVISNPHPV